jgi:2-C-methyl-D-erythritol 4-phosphate cytidylyltransferase
METLAILVAAGRGERLAADRPKAFVELAGEAMLLRAARAFEEADVVDGVVVVVPEAESVLTRTLLEPISKLTRIIPGGATRQESVRAGLAAAPPDFRGVVLVHDAARPLVDAGLIEAVWRAARDHGAAVPLLPLVDTVKRVRDGVVVETLDRDELGAAQTPQGFRRELLERAFAEAERSGAVLTDEAMAVERLGFGVVVVPGTPRNRKLTTPADLEWAEHVLATGGEAR